MSKRLKEIEKKKFIDGWLKFKVAADIFNVIVEGLKEEDLQKLSQENKE